MELLRVGKRLEQMGSGIFIDLWPLVLSFCGRGWFELEEEGVFEDEEMIDSSQDNLKMAALSEEMEDAEDDTDPSSLQL